MLSKNPIYYNRYQVIQPGATIASFTRFKLIIFYVLSERVSDVSLKNDNKLILQNRQIKEKKSDNLNS